MQWEDMGVWEEEIGNRLLPILKMC